MPRRISIPLTRERLREVVDYDPATGVFTWRAPPSKYVAPGTVAGFTKGNGYRYISIDGKSYRASRLAWFYEHGEMPGRRLSYKNGIRTDLRIANIVPFFHVEGDFDLSTVSGRSEYKSAWNTARGDLLRVRDLKRSFGITPDDYQRMFDAQNGLCAICAKPEKALRNGRQMRLAVDHNHTTGAIRGLLCTCCNPMIGHSKEDESILAKAIEYLRSHNTEIGVDGNVVALRMKEK